MNGFGMTPFGFGFFGFGMLFWWILWVVIAYLVYQDAEKRGMNGLLWFILVLIPMVGIIALIIYLIVRETQPQAKEEKKSSLEILKERYAKGEISHEEYERMKKELEE
ncbi:SHOCT domain-containing protein [Geoglobus acetivorans]|uniref:SHOCT domain-containing protein n=1 Tax=Geoglobus acetivorans TaxID=565033 RepID=A0ABZ3H846_GEOAI|nr:SHOCT domain-containing protein [Geoglobus acetivorans]